MISSKVLLLGSSPSADRLLKFTGLDCTTCQNAPVRVGTSPFQAPSDKFFRDVCITP